MLRVPVRQPRPRPPRETLLARLSNHDRVADESRIGPSSGVGPVGPDSVGQDLEWRSGLDRENRFADRLCRPRRGDECAEQDALAAVDDDR